MSTVPQLADVTRTRFERLPHWLFASYAFFWLLLAIDPPYRADWAIENVVSILWVSLFVGTYRRFRFTDASYILIWAFLMVHAVGAHYTYGQVPLGYWLKDAFHLARNPFDRIGHFAFGFLGAYPFREALIRLVGVRGFWAYYLPLDVVLAMSAFYELLEAWAAQLFSPAMNDSILGLQGDFWDAQWDMTASFAGAIIALFLTWLIERRARKGDPVPSKRVAQR